MLENINIVVIGGGTGTYSVLSGLKKYTDKITAVVTMADSGGSARKERDEWGLLPSSDIRKSLLALAAANREDTLLLRKLFQYRYREGRGVTGMTFGNLLLIALTKLIGSQEKAIEKAGELLHIRGKVLPVSLDKVNLAATYIDGTNVIGEHFIDRPKHNGKLEITRLFTSPVAKITTEAEKTILSADLIIIGPGGFYTTILANLVVDGVSEALKKSRAKKIFILNLMTEYGQTYGFTASKFVTELDKYFPVNHLDYLFINDAPIPNKILKRYARYHASPVVNDLSQSYKFKVITADLLSKKEIKKEKGDSLQRSFIRHSPDKIAKLCLRILNLV